MVLSGLAFSPDSSFTCCVILGFFFFYMKMYISITEFQGLNTFISQILCEHFLSTGGTEMNKNNGLLLDLREFMF